MSKIYIGLITQNQKQNIDELTSVAKYFDGLAAVDHFSNDGTYELLQERKGNGFVEQIQWYGHTGHSMNHFLFNPILDQDSWILLRDSSERINEDFARNIHKFVNLLERSNIYSVINYSKMMLFKRFPNQFFTNTPHWGLQGSQPGYLRIEESGLFKSEEEYCYSVRNKNRDEFHFINHYFKYYLILDSNHCLLGCENNIKEFERREILRREFLRYCRAELSIDPTVANLISFWTKNPLTDKMKYFINSELILNNAYTYNILGNRDITDKHDKNTIVII